MVELLLVENMSKHSEAERLFLSDNEILKLCCVSDSWNEGVLSNQQASPPQLSPSSHNQESYKLQSDSR